MAAQWRLDQPSVPPHPIASPGKSTMVTFLEEAVKPSHDGDYWGKAKGNQIDGQFFPIRLRDQHSCTPVRADA